MVAPEQEEGTSSISDNIQRNWQHLKSKLFVFLTLFILFSLVLVAYFFNLIFITIYPGEAGVYWERFHGGTNMDYVYNEGLHIIPPWNKMYIYNTRIQHKPFLFGALSKDGLPINFEVSVRYFPDRDQLPLLHKRIGPDYVRKVIKPEVQANLRKVVANYLPEEIYTSEGYLLQIIKQGAMGALSQRHIILDNLLIRKMILPATIIDAIERKLIQKQYVQEYEYLLETEAKEARRKAIEAGGIKRFQDIVKTSKFFDKYLQFKGIDATVSLAKSKNSKVVIIGGGKGNLPLIMNMDATTPETQGTDTEAENVANEVIATPPVVKASQQQPDASKPGSAVGGERLGKKSPLLAVSDKE